ncbi:unnamed protein product [Soboliphyme baturini]|uniref:HEAT repeat-containing protein 1 n=1 Tax=Soboliphyme baturini TaxID=241478 RepID=A0A3P8FFP9_9BILA|nr:unnamed protein product [Soboliphyme baturini]
MLLTRDDYEIQNLCVNNLRLIIDAAELSVSALDPNAATESECQYKGQEGGRSGKLEVGKSIVYASLEVILCLLTKQIPQINPLMFKNKSKAHWNCFRMVSKDSSTLVEASLTCLLHLPRLCSPEGQLVVLPIIVYLLINVLRESSKIEKLHFTSAPSFSKNLSSPATVSLQALKSIVKSPVYEPNCNGELSHRWKKMIQCAFSSVLAFRTFASEEWQIDHSVIVLAVAVFLLSAPKPVLNNSFLIVSSIELFQDCLRNPNLVVQQKCLRTLQSLFVQKEMPGSVRLIQSLTVPVVEKLKIPTSLLRDSSAESALQLAVITEAEKVLEALLTVLVEEYRTTFLALIMQLLALFLLKNPSGLKPSDPKKQLHDLALQRLNSLSAIYTDEFRHLLKELPEVKDRLELAMKKDAAISNQLNAAYVQNIANAEAAGSVAPSITLTMDFSSFMKN